MTAEHPGPEDSVPPRRIESFEDLVQGVDLVGIRWFEVSGARVEGDDSAASDANMALDVREQHDTGQLEARFRATVTSSDGRYVADVGMQYRFDEPSEPSQNVVRQFLEAVGIMAAWPFLREAVAATAARMELEVPVLPLMRQGDFALDEDGSPG